MWKGRKEKEKKKENLEGNEKLDQDIQMPPFQMPLIHASYKNLFSHHFLFFASSLLLHHFFLSIDNVTAPWTTHSSCKDLGRRTHGNSHLHTISPIFVLPWLTFAFCIITPSFVSRSIGTATDIEFLAPGLEGHVVRLGIRRKALRILGEILF
jgi:hypothetical protein